MKTLTWITYVIPSSMMPYSADNVKDILVKSKAYQCVFFGPPW